MLQANADAYKRIEADPEKASVRVLAQCPPSNPVFCLAYCDVCASTGACNLYWHPPDPVMLTVRGLPLQWPQQLNASLAEVDPELADIIEKEKNRQWKVRHCGSCKKQE